MSVVDADLTGALEAANAPSPFAIVLLAEDAGNSGSTSRSELEALRKAYPAATVAVISDHDDSETILRAVRGGAKGFIHTSLRSEAVVHALRVLIAGGEFVPRTAVMSFHTNGPAEPAAPDSDHDLSQQTLSPREREVYDLLRQGKPNKVIAANLAVAENTVKVHIRNIMKKMKARNRLEVMIKTPSLPTRPSRQ